MPWASDQQRRWMFATHPAMAHRWAKEGPAPSRAPRQFIELVGRGLVGISDRVIAEHLRLYERAALELDGIDRALARAPWRPPLDVPSNEIQGVLDSPVAALMQPFDESGSVMQPDGRLAACLSSLRDELIAKGISWFPNFYFGDADFWTTDRATSINIPWYLATDRLWDLVNSQTANYTEPDVMQVLRHEAGHALGYAFGLWHRPEWQAAFGDFEQPYRDTFEIDPASTDFVLHLHDSAAAPNAHYAQKHPDEDWAETFATWLDPGARWREAYAAMPGALAKLEAVELMIVGRGAAYGDPPNTALGRRVPASTLTYTVAEFLGMDEPGAPDARAALARRLPEVYASTILHEVYFEQLRRGAGASTSMGMRLALAISTSYGSPEGWAADARAIVAATDGWMVTAWCPREARVRNVLVEGHSRGLPPDARVLLAVDCHEHAYAGDVGTRKDIYAAAVWRNIDWTVIDSRFNEASPPPPLPTLLPMPPVVEVAMDDPEPII